MLTIEQKINLISELASDLYESMKEGREVSKPFLDFLQFNNLGVPFSIGFNSDYITLTKEGESIINETFLDMCKLLEIDPNMEYEDEEDFWLHEGTAPEEEWGK